ncbi:MAG: FAD binding domain-containing protein [Caldilineaceae bacterium]
MYKFYLSPLTLADALTLKAQHEDAARVIAGGTDLIIEMDRGVRSGPDGGELGVIDLTRVPGLAEIWEADGWIHLGALVTHNQCVASPLIVDKAFPLARACWEVGAPQIRNRGTVAGNIITASPANDSIVPLRALNATVTVQSAARGERTLPIEDFVTGFRRVDLAPDEIVTRISLRSMTEHERGNFLKLGLRRAQAISVNSVAAVAEIDPNTADSPTPMTLNARISLGAVAPVIVRADAAESFLAGKALTDDVIAEAARLATTAASPIDDIRGSGEYRLAMVEALTARVLRQIRDGSHRSDGVSALCCCGARTDGKWPVDKSYELRIADCDDATQAKATTMIAIRNPQFAIRRPPPSTANPSPAPQHDAARQPARRRLRGREGRLRRRGMRGVYCLFGWNCGDGVSCPRGTGGGQRGDHRGGAGRGRTAAWGAGGVGAERRRAVWILHARLVMSAAKLLEERPHLTRGEAQEALTGNLCRCTGYRKILDVVVLAGNIDNQ